MEPKRINTEKLNQRLVGDIKNAPEFSDLKKSYDEEQPQVFFQGQNYGAKDIGKEPKQIDLEATPLRSKIQEDDKTLDIFLRNLFPVIGSNVLSTIESAGNTEPKIGGTMSMVQGAFSALVQSRYLTPSELVIYLGSNFYTLHFVRGITAKQFTGFFGSEWSGYPDLTFGRNYTDILPSLSDALGAIGDAISPNVPTKSDDNKEIKDAKSRTSPAYYGTIGFGGTLYRQVLGSDPLQKGNRRRFTNLKAVNQFTYRNLVKTNYGDWIDAGVNFSNTGERGKHATSKDDYLLDGRVRDIRYNRLEKGDDKWVDRGRVEDWDRKPKKHSVQEEEYFVSDKVLNISLPNDEVGTKGDIETLRPDLWSVGYIYVMPQTRDNSFSNYKLPFEFNPSISTGGITTQYNAQNILSRIGSLQTFSHVELSTVEITTKYYAMKSEEEGEDNRGSVGNSWMDIFTLSFLQGIQSGYEALSYPFFPSSEEQNIEKGFKYVKPPLVKVIIGDAGESEDAPYSNLLTYPRDINDDNEILSSTKSKRLYKTFLVSSVNIEKNMEETPLYIRDKKIRDTFGFSISLSLVEVTKNYMDVMPNYENYFNHFQTMISNNDLIDNS